MSEGHALPAPPAFLASRGALTWLFSLDHKRIALMQLVGVLVVGVLGALAGLALQLAPGAESSALSGALRVRLHTLHSLGLVLLVAVPAIAGTLGAFLLPLQLGARAIAFPRLLLASFYSWVLGAVLIALAAYSGLPPGGWQLPTALDAGAADAMGMLALAIAVLALSTLLRSFPLIVTVHAQRAKGLAWRRVPLFTWSLYAQALVQLVAAPMLVLAALLLIGEQRFGLGLFMPPDGDPSLFQHLYWFGLHGLLYSSALPAIGLVGEVFAQIGRRGLSLARAQRVALFLLALLSLLSWGQHFPVSGHSLLSEALFSLASLAMLVPSVVILVSWLQTLAGGRWDAHPATLLALLAAGAFVVSACSGLILSVPGLGQHLHATSFTTAHAHFALLGGGTSSLLAGLLLWWPKLTGTKLPSRGLTACIAGLALGLLLAWGPGFVAGGRGALRVGSSAAAGGPVLNGLSLLGTVLLLGSFSVLVTLLLRTLSHGRPAVANPWQLEGMEWQTSSPPPTTNFLAPTLSDQQG
jgi:cytochrome c oxidase subunit 1